MYALFTAVRFDADQGAEDRAVQVLHDELINLNARIDAYLA